MTIATATIVLAGLALGLAAVPAGMLLANLRQFRRSPPPPADLPPVSVLVPARNEQAAIGRLIDDLLASQGIDLELLILDDASTDDTAAIVAAAAARDERVRLITGRPLPAGWCGKQHACFQLAGAARYQTLLFLDAPRKKLGTHDEIPSLILPVCTGRLRRSVGTDRRKGPIRSSQCSLCRRRL